LICDSGALYNKVRSTTARLSDFRRLHIDTCTKSTNRKAEVSYGHSNKNYHVTETQFSIAPYESPEPTRYYEEDKKLQTLALVKVKACYNNLPLLLLHEESG
jgi:hypothetical protein